MIRRTTTWIAWIAVAASGLTPLAAVEAVFAQQIEVTELQFNQILTNSRVTPQQGFETQLNGRLGRLDAACELTAHQREKLEFAGRGDIARFESDLAPIRNEFLGKSFDQNRFDEIYQKLAPFSERIRRGILDDGSLFEKVLANTLDREQRQAYENAEAEQIAYLYRAKMKLLVATLDAAAPMLDKQREDLLAQLLKNTRPPKRWVERREWMYVLYQASTTPRNELAKTLDAAQLRCFDSIVKAGARSLSILKQEGMMPTEDDSGQKDDRRKDGAAIDHIPVIQIGVQ